MSANPHNSLAKEFLDAFEEVFDKDWGYTKQMLGIRESTPEDEENFKKLGLEEIPIVARDGTFLNPKVEDEVEDWGNRGRLLTAYRAFREAVSR